MPANLQQLHDAISRIGGGLEAARRILQGAQSKALAALRESAGEPEDLAKAVDREASADPGLRCAAPYLEDISAGYACPPVNAPAALLAVDGSQVLADRHAEVLFAIINVGSVIIEPGSGKAPKVITETRLLFGDDLYAANGRELSEGDLALLRDAGERQSLLANAPSVSTLIALGDGPLELWGPKEVSDEKAFDNALRRYLAVLHELRQRDCTIAGYVDKPGADLVIRMLALAQSGSAGTVVPHGPSPYRGVTDRWLFGRILPPGQRSAIFALQSSSRTRYAGELAIHFFYLNVGHESYPALARVEIPKWVVDDARRVGVLHRTLLDQCAMLGSRPYPYILHRAHETARISTQEAHELKLRLLLEMRLHSVEPEPVSGKSWAKSASGAKGSR